MSHCDNDTHIYMNVIKKFEMSYWFRQFKFQYLVNGDKYKKDFDFCYTERNEFYFFSKKMNTVVGIKNLTDIYTEITNYDLKQVDINNITEITCHNRSLVVKQEIKTDKDSLVRLAVLYPERAATKRIVYLTDIKNTETKDIITIEQHGNVETLLIIMMDKGFQSNMKATKIYLNGFYNMIRLKELPDITMNQVPINTQFNMFNQKEGCSTPFEITLTQYKQDQTILKNLKEFKYESYQDLPDTIVIFDSNSIVGQTDIYNMHLFLKDSERNQIAINTKDYYLERLFVFDNKYNQDMLKYDPMGHWKLVKYKTGLYIYFDLNDNTVKINKNEHVKMTLKLDWSDCYDLQVGVYMGMQGTYNQVLTVSIICKTS